MEKTEIIIISAIGLVILSIIIYFGWFSPPTFVLGAVDKTNRSIRFKFGDAEHTFRSKQGMDQEYKHKNFTLKVKDVFVGTVFQNISFELYRGDTFIKPINPNIDYKFW